MAKNIIVSNRLPIQLTKLDNSFEFTPTSGGLATGMNSVHKGQNSLWVGWPGINSDEIDKNLEFLVIILPLLFYHFLKT